MKDRIPLYPGRVKMTPVSGQANIYDMERADQPTQEGTPLSKATLLSDATAAALGLAGDDPTVDEALLKLRRESEYLVGDIRQSLLNLEEKSNGDYLLCDGRTVIASQYPALKEITIGEFPNNFRTIDIGISCGMLSDDESEVFGVSGDSSGNDLFVVKELGNLENSYTYNGGNTGSTQNLSQGFYFDGNFIFLKKTKYSSSGPGIYMISLSKRTSRMLSSSYSNVSGLGAITKPSNAYWLIQEPANSYALKIISFDISLNMSVRSIVNPFGTVQVIGFSLGDYFYIISGGSSAGIYRMRYDGTAFSSCTIPGLDISKLTSRLKNGGFAKNKKFLLLGTNPAAIVYLGENGTAECTMVSGILSNIGTCVIPDGSGVAYVYPAYSSGRTAIYAVTLDGIPKNVNDIPSITANLADGASSGNYKRYPAGNSNDKYYVRGNNSIRVPDEPTITIPNILGYSEDSSQSEISSFSKRFSYVRAR